MKRFLIPLWLALGLPLAGWAATGPYTLFNGTDTYSAQYPVDLQFYGSSQTAAGHLSAQVTWSSGVFTSQTFTDGQASTGALVVVSTSSLGPNAATDYITVPATSLLLGTAATNYFSISSDTALSGRYITVNGTVIQNSNYYTAYASMTALGLAQFLNSGFSNLFVSTVAYGGFIVTSTAAVAGTGGNAYTFASSTVAMKVGGANFYGGTNDALQNATITVDSVVYVNGGNWTDSSLTSTGTAQSIAAMINLSSGITATAATYPLALPATGYITVLSTTGLSGAVITVNGVGSVNLGYGVAFASNSYTSFDSTATALSLANAITQYSLDTGLVAATSNYTTIYATATTPGTAGNSYTITSSTPAVISSGVFAGGTNSTYGSVVYATATIAAAAGNLHQFAVSTTAFKVGGLNFSSGRDSATITINGYSIKLGSVQGGSTWTIGSTSTTAQAAIAISSCIDNNSYLSTIVVASATTGSNTATTTSTAVGYNTTYAWSTNTSSITYTNTGLYGGISSSWTLVSGSATVINVGQHNFAPGLAVLFSTGTKAITGLTNQTTYYVIVVDSNDVSLASSSTGSVAGLAVVLTSSNTPTAKDTYTLAPLAYSQGTASGLWQVSNDGVNWATLATTIQNVAVSSQTFTAVAPSTGTIVDFGPIDYGWIRYNVLGPTQGGVQLKVILNAKD